MKRIINSAADQFGNFVIGLALIWEGIKEKVPVSLARHEHVLSLLAQEAARRVKAERERDIARADYRELLSEMIDCKMVSLACSGPRVPPAVAAARYRIDRMTTR